MKIIFEISKELKEELLKRKALIEELLLENFNDLEFSEENLIKAKELRIKCNKAIGNDWNIKPIQIMLANSKGEELANIR